MFEVGDLTGCLAEKWLTAGYAKLERNLLLGRLGLEREELTKTELRQLRWFSQSVMASAAYWDNPRSEECRRLCQVAADIEAALATGTEGLDSHLSLFKAILLYELAGLVGASSTYAARNGFDPRFRSFFTRSEGTVWNHVLPRDELAELESSDHEQARYSNNSLVDAALGELAQEAGFRIQKGRSGTSLVDALRQIASRAADFNLAVTGDDLHALAKLVQLREKNSTANVLAHHSAIDPTDIQALTLPVELWPAQMSAIRKGLLDPGIQNFGFAAPTGTGKTSLTRALIASMSADHPGKKVLYLCPSRALVSQVARDLREALGGIGLSVLEVGAHLTVHKHLPISSDEADVLVFTPERADLLLRVDPEFLSDVRLVVVDEAHHIEQSGRGILLEFYLWRLRQTISSEARIVQLSAVAPNISDLTDWLGGDGDTASVMDDSRSSRLRVGVLERGSSGSAILQFGDTSPYTVLPDSSLPRAPRAGIAVLANHLSKQGTVLVLCTSSSGAEEVANLVHDLRDGEQDTSDAVSERLDAWVERELYPESTLRTYYKKRVLFHHAKMPPRVRSGIESAIRERKVDVICATTTLAEGVNFPFSTVIVESLVGKDYQISPRSLWNIAGRAGRFGVDTEGHCIIYRPSIWQSKLTEFSLADYLKTRLVDIPKVKSALATGIENLHELVRAGHISRDQLNSISLTDIKVDGKRTKKALEVRSLLNIVRVGYAHAASTGVVDLVAKNSGLENSLLASRQVSPDSIEFANEVVSQQKRVIKKATDAGPKLIEIAAQVGWSLEAQSLIYAWVQNCKDWQLEQFGKIVIGGSVRDFEKLGYLIGPLAKHLLAFEGQPLGGFMSFKASKWIEGIPLVRMEPQRDKIGPLVKDIYGRIRYLLPWGLYGLHELVQYEAKRRGVSVQDGISDLSALAAEGVPNFDALTLVHLGIERVDATRLSTSYRSRYSDTNVVDWFRSRQWYEVERVVRGSDGRRIDPILSLIHRGVGHDTST